MSERRFHQDAIRQDTFRDPGSLADRRAQVEHEQLQRMEERRQEIALLSSPLRSAEERIRQWEKLHALSLPRSPMHKLVRIIAEQTELALDQVLEIQRRRFAPPAPPVPVTVT